MLPLRFLLATVSFAALLPFAVQAQTATPAPNPNAPVTRADIPALVREAIMNDPDMIMKAVEKLRQKQMEEGQKESQDSLQKHKTELFSDKESPSAGSKNPDVTLVEFFDYHCALCCKKTLPVITQLDEKTTRKCASSFANSPFFLPIQ